MDVSALLRGISSVQTLSLNSLTHTNSKDKHNQLFKTLVLAHMFFFSLIISVGLFLQHLLAAEQPGGQISEI